MIMIIILSKIDLSTFVCIGICQPFTQSGIPPPTIIPYPSVLGSFVLVKTAHGDQKDASECFGVTSGNSSFHTRASFLWFFWFLRWFFWISRKIHWSVLVLPWAVPHFYTRAVILFYWMDELLTAIANYQKNAIDRKQEDNTNVIWWFVMLFGDDYCGKIITRFSDLTMCINNQSSEHEFIEYCDVDEGNKSK